MRAVTSTLVEDQRQLCAPSRAARVVHIQDHEVLGDQPEEIAIEQAESAAHGRRRRGYRAVVGTIDLTVAHGYLVRALLAESAGDGPEVTAYRERMQTRYAEERDGVLSTLAVDKGQTGAASLRDAWTRHLPLMRG